MKLKFWEKPHPARPGYFRTPRILTAAEETRQNLERLLALANTPDSNPIWKTLLSYADEHANNEQESAIAANLTNESRQYNAGRAASALDFALALRDLRAQANLQARKMEKRAE